MGEFWIFGGDRNLDYERQVRNKLGEFLIKQIFKASKIKDCKLVRQTNLIFDFERGSCNTFVESTPKVLLCFDENESKRCHTFDGRYYEAAGTSSFSHRKTTGLGIYHGKAFTTGCDEDDENDEECGTKTEMMNMSTLRWESGPDYPFGS